MKTAIVFVIAFVAVCSATRHPRDTKYTTKYDNIDIDTILKNERLLNNYLKCLLDQGRCTPEGEELKKVIPDALKTACSKCSETQKKGTEKVVRYLIEQKPDKFDQLEKKYDPEGTYRQKYDAELKKRGITA